MPSGHTTVPASGSIVTWAKYAGSFSGSRTPVHRSAEKSTSPAVPSLNSRRSTWSPTTATPATTGRYFSLMATMLRQRRYGEQRLAAPRPLPIGHQFGAVELGPVPDESQRPRFQISRNDGSVDRDRRAPSGVVGVEVGDWVIPL